MGKKIMGRHYFKCNTLKNGMVVVFDYRLNECNRNGDDLVLAYKDREMVVPHAELKKRAMLIDKAVHPSEFGKPFKYYHFKWEPTDGEEHAQKQNKLFSNKK